jgi:hypothetical protein
MHPETNGPSENSQLGARRDSVAQTGGSGGRRLGVALLALIAGTVPYLHMHLLVELHGQPGWGVAG